jgi:hypothetical protein
MRLSNYQFKICNGIEEKLVEYAQTEAKSLYNIDIMYHAFIQDISILFHNPEKHYTKICKLAYNKVLREYEQ